MMDNEFDGVYEPSSDYHTRSETLKARTKQFALDVVKLYPVLRKREESRIMGRQLLRSATSVAANYRAVCRARTQAQFISKLDIVVEEIDESQLWLDLLIDSGLLKPESASELVREADEPTRIFAAARATAVRRQVGSA